MKKKTRLLATVLCLSLFATMAMGSGSSSDDKKDIVTSEGNSATKDNAEKITIKKKVLVNKGGIKITASKYATDSILGDGIKLLIENKSKKSYTVGCDALIVNDYMITDLFASEIAAGKKSNETMYLSSAELEAAGITNVGKIEMYFHAYDDNMKYAFKKSYSELRTSAYKNMDKKPNDSGKVLYKNKGIKIVGKTVDEDSFWGTAILLYIENNSKKDVGISVEELSVNGFMIDPIFSTTIYSGKKCIDEITLLSSDLEENDIKKIKNVELKFKIYSDKSYQTIAKSDKIKFSAK